MLHFLEVLGSCQPGIIQGGGAWLHSATGVLQGSDTCFKEGPRMSTLRFLADPGGCTLQWRWHCPEELPGQAV